MDWRRLLPNDAEVILSSTGNFVFDGGEKNNLGVLALTHDRLYVILFKGFAGQTPWMHASIPMKDLRNLRVSGALVRSLEFDFAAGSGLKHADFISLDCEVREIMEKIEYEADNSS
ncbi:MAG: hypothetical protein V1787_03890 [Candidatus Micrarchaeota archaeon]